MKSETYLPALCVCAVAIILSPSQAVGQQTPAVEAPVPGADVSEEPDWLVLARGLRAYDEHEFGEAMRYFRWAKARRAVYPEADYWIGAVFRVEQEYTLAVEQFRRAYEDRNALLIPAEQYRILYELADLYELLDRYPDYEQTLRRIIETSPEPASPISVQLDETMYRVLVEQGVDKLLELYRLEDSPAMEARFRLGVFLFRTGRVGEGARQLTHASVSGLSVVIDYLFERNPVYEYRGVRAALLDAEAYDALVGFIGRSDLFERLYYLGVSLNAGGVQDHAETLWRLVRDIGAPSPFADRARRQLIAPFREPLLDIRG